VSPKTWTIKGLLRVTADYLEKKEIDNPRLCAELLLAHQLEINRVKLYLSFDQPLNDIEISGYRSLIKRRISREPTQYITGVQEFWSMDFHVTPQVLIPRPESELLVEQVLSLCGPTPSILDLGTGSGALAVSLAREIEGASLWASDISRDSLDVAILNSEKHSVEGRIKFVQGDLWQPFPGKNIRFDFIVSNPPYIAAEEYDSLAPEVRDHEPRQALDGREGGFFFIERIISGGAEFLNPGGWLLMEMDPRQTQKSLELFDKNGHYGDKKRLRDYTRRYRVVMAQKRAEG